jgi:hypothetical protein
MSQQMIGEDVNNGICEAVGCFEKATNKINVKVGQQGIILLHLCKACVNKFREEEPE